MSRKLKLQPWVIFSDQSLDEMSIMYPITLDELRNCQGVGVGKAQKFGPEFIKLIKSYVEENEISRPDDFVLKTTGANSSVKLFIIQSIDRRLSLEDVASAKGMDMDELLGEIEAIVATGTRLDLNYYIEETLDEDVVEEIYDWFRNEATSDSLAEARETLSADYEDMEIRLVRLKFLCEVAN